MRLSYLSVSIFIVWSCPTLPPYGHRILWARILEWIPGIEPRSPILEADSLPAEPQGLSVTLLPLARIAL